MARKRQNNTQTPPVTLREGKWVTSDGMCFNTSAKAWKHIEETTAQEPPVDGATSCAENTESIGDE